MSCNEPPEGRSKWTLRLLADKAVELEIIDRISYVVEARIIALSCNEPPEGRSKWTLRLLADKAVELEIIDRISYVSVGQVLKKTNSNRI